MKMTEKIRKAFRSLLRLNPPNQSTFTIDEELDFWANAFANKLWYRGSGSELNQFYKQLNSSTCPFWGSVPTRGLEIRKIHTGIPKIVVNTLTNIVIRDLNDITYDNVEKNDLWEAIAKENKLNGLLTTALTDALVIGDGAMKISFDPDLSDYPILEWVPGDRVEFEYDRGRLKAIIFRTEYFNKAKYTLVERYGRGSLQYKLYKDENEVALNAIPETAMLQDLIFDKSFMLAVPFKIFSSDFTGKILSLVYFYRSGKSHLLTDFVIIFPPFFYQLFFILFLQTIFFQTC